MIRSTHLNCACPLSNPYFEAQVSVQKIKSATMPTKSSFPDVEIPDVDLWGLMFDRKDRNFSDDKGNILKENTELASMLMSLSAIPHGEFGQGIHLC